MRKGDVEMLEAMERGLRGGTIIEDDVLDRLLKLGMLEVRKRDTYTLTNKARTYLLRRKSVKRGRKTTKSESGPMGGG
jgi:hypothetical protein